MILGSDPHALSPLPARTCGEEASLRLNICGKRDDEGRDPRGIKQKGQAVKHLKGGNTEEDKYGMGMAIPRERWRRSRLPLTCIKPVVVVVRSEQN